ncbi:MAG: exonuclease domain-containing protein, partial [Desulfitobacterium hafniense]
KNLYGAHYTVHFADKVNPEDLVRLQEATQEKELQLIQKERLAVPSAPPPAAPPKEAAPAPVESKTDDGKKNDPQLILGRNAAIKDKVIKITDITPDEGKIALQGELSNIEAKELKSGKTLVSFDLYDGSSSITCKSFLKPGEDSEVISRLQKAKGVKLSGNAGFSKFSGEIELIAHTIVETEGVKKYVRQDLAKAKRVELHLHTQMSQMDAMSGATDLIKRAMNWGMKAIAITDHGVVQSFPEAHKLLGRDNPNMKVIYGVEAYLAPDKKPSVTHPQGQSIDTTYCVLDLETTGFSAVTEKITEIGIMKIQGGKIIDQFGCFVNPEKPIPARVVEVTNITDDMVRDAETIDQVFPKLLQFIEGSVLVAHNADFDIGFLKHNAKVLGYDFDYTYLDTLSLAKELFPDYKTYKLG